MGDSELTEKERTILALLDNKLTVGEIARRVGISIRSVGRLLDAIHCKLDGEDAGQKPEQGVLTPRDGASVADENHENTYPKLTDMECGALTWRAKGLDIIRVANRMKVKPVVVNACLARARLKLKTATTKEAINKARGLNLLDQHILNW